MFTGRLSASVFAFRRLRFIAIALALFVCFATISLRAQGGSARSPAAPIAPSPPIASDAAAARLTGSIADPSGALIPGARVVLRPVAAASGIAVSSDSGGHFSFSGVKPGKYALTVSAEGFDDADLLLIQLHPGEVRDLPTLSLGVPTSHADVFVSLTEHELATEELHVEEHQRVLGFPDFYTVYDSNPAPLETRQKFSLALHATTDEMSFVGAALIAGGEQVQNTFPTYGHGFTGYAKRYGAAYTDAFTGKLIGYALLPSLFHQDPRYFYLGTGTYKHRAIHAILSAVIVRGDNGRMEPNYSHILGNAAAGALSTAYHPATDSAGKLALDNALLGTAGEAGVNLIREFALKHFTRGLTTSTAP